jgi:hypothetical protein
MNDVRRRGHVEVRKLPPISTSKHPPPKITPPPPTNTLRENTLPYGTPTASLTNTPHSTHLSAQNSEYGTFTNSSRNRKGISKYGAGPS